MNIRDALTAPPSSAITAAPKPQTESATARGSAFPLLDLPVELVLHCIDGLEKDYQTMLSFSFASQATRSLVANTALYRSYVAQKSQALLEHAFHLEEPLSKHSLLRGVKSLEIFQVPDAFETPAHLHAILSAADAIESLTVHPRWFRLPFFDVLTRAAETHDRFETLRVQHGFEANQVPHDSDRDLAWNILSDCEQQRLTQFLHVFTRKENSTLLLNIPIEAINVSKIFLQALPQPNHIANLSFFMPMHMAMKDVFAVIQKLVASPALKRLEINGSMNVGRSDRSVPKLISILDAIAATETNLRLLDLSSWHDMYNNHLRLLDERLDKLPHLGAVRCPVAINFRGWAPSNHGYFGLNDRLISSTAPKIHNVSGERSPTFYLNTPASFFGSDATEATSPQGRLKRDQPSETSGLF